MKQEVKHTHTHTHTDTHVARHGQTEKRRNARSVKDNDDAGSSAPSQPQPGRRKVRARRRLWHQHQPWYTGAEQIWRTANKKKTTTTGVGSSFKRWHIKGPTIPCSTWVVLKYRLSWEISSLINIKQLQWISEFYLIINCSLCNSLGTGYK